jgi:hypothetical protein
VITATADQIKLNGEETLMHARTVKETSNKVFANTEHLLPQFERMNRNIESLFEQMMREVQAQATTILAETNAVNEKLSLADQASSQPSSNTDMILQRLSHSSLENREAGNSMKNRPAVLKAAATDVFNPRSESQDTYPKLVQE